MESEQATKVKQEVDKLARRQKMDSDMALAKVKKDLAASGLKETNLMKTQLTKAQKDVSTLKTDLKKANDLAAGATKLEKQLKEIENENMKMLTSIGARHEKALEAKESELNQLKEQGTASPKIEAEIKELKE